MEVFVINKNRKIKHTYNRVFNKNSGLKLFKALRLDGDKKLLIALTRIQ